MGNDMIRILFSNPDFGNIRAVTINGEPWLVGKDVALALGYSNPRDALAKHVDSEDKNTVAFRDGISGNPDTTVINEPGLYSLILSSKLSTAKQFKRWVTSEVLPSIRRMGAYLTPDMALNLQAVLSAMSEQFTAQQEKLDKLEHYIIKVGHSQNCTNYFPLRELGSQKTSAWKRGVTGKLKVLETEINMPAKEILHYIYEYMKKQLGVNLDVSIELYKKVNGIKTCSALDVVDDSKSLRQSFDEAMTALFGAVGISMPELDGADSGDYWYRDLIARPGAAAQ